MNSLYESKVFKVVDITDISLDSQLFKVRFIDKIKFAGTEKAFEKSRLVV